MSMPRQLRHEVRAEMNLAIEGVTGVPLLGRYHYTTARPALREHVHKNAVEICFLETGHQRYRLLDKTYDLTGGDVFICPPNIPHDTGGLPEEKGVLYWVVLEAPTETRRLLDLPHDQGKAVWKALISSPTHFKGSALLKTQMDSIPVLFRGKRGQLRSFALTTHLRAFVLELLNCSQIAVHDGSGKPMSLVCEYVRTHLDEPLPVRVLAEVRGLSVPRFKARFKQELGIPPSEYVLRQKIGRAEQLLLGTARNVTDITYELGFSNSQYFATVFKRFTGFTPTAFRLQKRSVIG